MRHRTLVAWLLAAAACLLAAGGTAVAQQVDPPRKMVMRPKRGAALVSPAGYGSRCRQLLNAMHGQLGMPRLLPAAWLPLALLPATP